MPVIQIKHRITNAILFEGEFATLREAALKAISDKKDLRGAYLQGAYLHGAYLQGADLRGAYLRGAYLQGADLQGADLRGAYLQGADLQGADLRGAYLQGAYLHGAYLQGADLQGAYLQGADLQGAYLRGAYLQGAKGVNKYLCTPLRILLDQPGKIRAYKLVNQSGVGPFKGGLIYKKGKTITVKDADKNEQVECSTGIHLATLDWVMRNWQPTYKIFIVEFTAKDIAAIPTATDGKFRVRKCKVVGEKDLVELGLVTEKDLVELELVKK